MINTQLMNGKADEGQRMDEETNLPDTESNREDKHAESREVEPLESFAMHTNL